MKRKYILLAVLLSIPAVWIGCIMTGTVVITSSLVPDSEGNDVLVTDAYYDEAEQEVDLTDDATYKEYRNDIRNIENVGFYLSAENTGNVDVNFQLFLEPDTTENYESSQAMVDSLADIILTDLVIPANQKVVIDWNESVEYITNLDYFKDVIEGGVFSLYPAAIPRDNFDIVIDSLVVIITLTGQK